MDDISGITQANGSPIHLLHYNKLILELIFRYGMVAFFSSITNLMSIRTLHAESMLNNWVVQAMYNQLTRKNVALQSLTFSHYMAASGVFTILGSESGMSVYKSEPYLIFLVLDCYRLSFFQSCYVWFFQFCITVNYGTYTMTLPPPLSHPGYLHYDITTLL